MTKKKRGAVERIHALDDCLTPLRADAALSFADAALALDGTPSAKGVSGVLLRAADTQGDLGPLCSSLQFETAPEAVKSLTGADAYDAALAAYVSGDPDTAGLAFALALPDPNFRAAATYGLAASLSRVGAFKSCLMLVEILVASGADHPMFSALAGNAAAALSDAGLTRKHLARAARRSRGNADFREILRFSQRTLLIQQFGT